MYKFGVACGHSSPQSFLETGTLFVAKNFLGGVNTLNYSPFFSSSFLRLTAPSPTLNFALPNNSYQLSSLTVKIFSKLSLSHSRAPHHITFKN